MQNNNPNATEEHTIETRQRIDVHQQVTDTIIKQLEAGTVPWHRPWKGGNSRLMSLPKNILSGNHYRGINIILLWCAALDKQYGSADWASFKQWHQKKERIRKGEKGSLIVFYDTFEKEVDGEVKKIPFLKSSVVFNRCQLESYQFEDKPLTVDEFDLVEKVDRIEDFLLEVGPIVKYGSPDAFYRVSDDTIYMPSSDKFTTSTSCTATEGFYSTLLHEVVHWSGAEKRLNRQKGKKFGDQQYAFEELVAELGSAFLCSEFQISTADKQDSANYIAGWLKVLRDNRDFIITAASEASKAVEYLKPMKLTA